MFSLNSRTVLVSALALLLTPASVNGEVGSLTAMSGKSLPAESPAQASSGVAQADAYQRTSARPMTYTTAARSSWQRTASGPRARIVDRPLQRSAVMHHHQTPILGIGF